jgi:polynucleotide 5'-kinase involved in rRNA processing
VLSSLIASGLSAELFRHQARNQEYLWTRKTSTKSEGGNMSAYFSEEISSHPAVKAYTTYFEKCDVPEAFSRILDLQSVNVIVRGFLSSMNFSKNYIVVDSEDEINSDKYEVSQPHDLRTIRLRFIGENEEALILFVYDKNTSKQVGIGIVPSIAPRTPAITHYTPAMYVIEYEE